MSTQDGVKLMEFILKQTLQIYKCCHIVTIDWAILPGSIALPFMKENESDFC